LLAYTCREQKDENVNQEILDNIAAAKSAKSSGTEFTYEEKDVILYNLGVGAKKTELPLVLCVLSPTPYYTLQNITDICLPTVRELKTSRLSQPSELFLSSVPKPPTASTMLSTTSTP
jgi:hypothetical protein